MIVSKDLPEITGVQDVYDSENNFYKLVINGNNFESEQNGKNPVFTSDNGKIIHTLNQSSATETYLEYRVEGLTQEQEINKNQLIFDIGYPVEHELIEEALEVEEIRFNNISIANGSTAGSLILANI